MIQNLVKNLFEHLVGIEPYGIISLCLFCGVFFGVLVWALLLKKPPLDRMARAPLEPEPDDLTNDSTP